jgi:hypothetical protein
MRKIKLVSGLILKTGSKDHFECLFGQHSTLN